MAKSVDATSPAMKDGIKHCAMSLLYSLQHIGYLIPPQADAGWIGEAGPGPSYGMRTPRASRLHATQYDIHDVEFDACGAIAEGCGRLPRAWKPAVGLEAWRAVRSS
jgi:hypothetical protein